MSQKKNAGKINLRQVAEWIGAGGVSLLIANLLIIPYFYDPGWISRWGGANRGVYEPHSTIIRADEGFTVSCVDGNGYINIDDNLAKSGYVLILGNSHSNGNNVMPEKKYVSRLSTALQRDHNTEKAMAYNVSVGGIDFCDIVAGFEAAQAEFPNSDGIVIQITTTDMVPEKLKTCTKQRIYSEEMKGSYLAKHLVTYQKVRNLVKDTLPLAVYTWELKLSKLKFSFEDAFWYQGEGTQNTDGNPKTDNAEYQKYLEQAMAFIKRSYEGKITVLYLPGVSIMDDGRLKVAKEPTEDTFSQVCMENGIQYLNMGERYRTEYVNAYVLPYGFVNTRMGYGHLNDDGHRMVADELYRIYGLGGAEE